MNFFLRAAVDTDIQDMAIIRDNAIRSVDQRFYSVAELDEWAEPLDMRLQKKCAIKCCRSA
jgi:hypothetical protein